MTIHDRFTDVTELARTYMEDGAFLTAAQRLETLATEIRAHYNWSLAPLVEEKK